MSILEPVRLPHQSPAASILTVLDRKEPKDIDDETLIRADVARKAIAQVRATVRDLLLSKEMPVSQADALADKLTGGAWTHDYPIGAEEARKLGLPVTTRMPGEIYDFMDLFEQPTRAMRPSVEYVPLPYRNGQARRSS